MRSYFNFRKAPTINKNNKYAYIYNKDAQNSTKCAHIGAFTNYPTRHPCIFCFNTTTTVARKGKTHNSIEIILN